MVLQLGIFLGALLSILHFLWESLAHRLHRYRMPILSFGFGVSTAYVFLQLFPELYAGLTTLNNGIFVFVLIGFAVMHLIETYSFKLNQQKKERFREEVAFEHSIAFFVYHFLLSIVLVNFLQRDIAQGVFFFVPLLMYTIVSSLSLAEIHEKISRNTLYKIILSSSSLLGAISGTYFFNLADRPFYMLLSFVTGSILYVIVRDTVPRRESSKPIFFFFGVLAYTLVVMYYWNLGGAI